MGRSKILVLCLLAVLCVGAVLWHAPSHSPRLTVRNDSGTLVFSAPLPQGREFGIRFVHSVALSPVEEWFTAKSGLLALQRTVYQDFGAGLPHEAGEGQRMTFADGRIVISGFSLEMGELEVRVGRVAGHELLLPETDAPEVAGSKNGVGTQVARVFPLAAWGAPGTTLTFAVEAFPLWEKLRCF